LFVSLAPKNAADLPKFVEGLRRLRRHSHVEVVTSDSGDHLIYASNARTLHEALLELKEDHLGDYVPLQISESQVQYKETVVQASERTATSRSPNKHNRMHMRAEPLASGLCEDMELGRISLAGGRSPVEDANARQRLVESYDWNPSDTRRVWYFGRGPSSSEGMTANVFVDCTRVGVSRTAVAATHLAEIRDSVLGAWEWTCREGVLADQPVRGVRMNLEEVTLHSDAIHRGAGQIMPTTRRCCYGAMLAATPRLMEPVYLAHIQVVADTLPDVYRTLEDASCGASDVGPEEARPPLVLLRAVVSVARSPTMVATLRANTSGRALAHFSFHGWRVCRDSPFEEGTASYDVVRRIRKAKGLKDEGPVWEDMCDA
jgi:elongation factor 2